MTLWEVCHADNLRCHVKWWEYWMSVQDWTSVMFLILILSSFIDFDNKLCAPAEYHKSIMKINVFINRWNRRSASPFDPSFSLRESIAWAHRQSARPHHSIDGGTEEYSRVRSTVCTSSSTNERNERFRNTTVWEEPEASRLSFEDDLPNDPLCFLESARRIDYSIIGTVQGSPVM